MSASSQFELFGPEERVTRRTLPCGLWQPDGDGYVALPGAAPLYAREFDAEDARLDSNAPLGRELRQAALEQLARLAALGCLTWASYERVDDGPWQRFPRGVLRRHPVLSAVSGFAAFRTDATARL